MFPLIPADLLRALGLVLIPAAWVTAGWPSAAVIFLVFGTQWLLRWLRGGSLLDWAGQLTLLAAGASDANVARQLGVSVRTVERRVRLVMERLGAQSRLQAGVEAVRRGLV